LTGRQKPPPPSWTLDDHKRAIEARESAAAAQPPSNPEAIGEAPARAAHEVAERIVGNVRRMRTLWIKVAEDLFRFNELEMYRDLGYTSFEQWLAEPDVDLSRRSVYYLLDVWRELVVGKGVKPAQLEKVDVSKVQDILPAVRRGQVTAEQALADAETLTRGDLRERYRAPAPSNGDAPPAVPSGPDTSTTYEATDEPAFAICPSCGSRYRVKS
jgi:hypothetical protein